LRYLLIVLLTLVGQTDLVWHAHTLEVFYEFAEIDVAGHEVALSVQTAELLGLRVQVDPQVADWRAVGFEDQAVGVIPNSHDVFGVMDD
jgi:hypothetical protein